MSQQLQRRSARDHADDGAQERGGNEVLARYRSDNDRLALRGLLVIQAIVGYEWLVSGLAKVSGNFVSTLGEELPAVSQDSPGWFQSILDAVVAPAPTFWGAVIAGGELLLGVSLIGAAVVWGLYFERLSRGGRTAVLGVTALAAFFGALLAVTLHLINGASHPWLIPGDGFDEGVDFDSVLPAIQLALLVVSVHLLWCLRRRRPRAQGS